MGNTPKKIKVLHYGLGAVGQNIARALQTLPLMESVAAVDVAPDLAGQSLGNLLGDSSKALNRVKIQKGLKKNGAHVALHATRSWIADIAPELETLIKAGLNVISTAEELVYPYGKNLKIIERLDRLAKKHHVRFMAAGVNPGFVLDVLPAVLRQATVQIEHVHATRKVNLAERRLQLQRKVGLGLSVAEFNERCRDPHFGHQGMNESLFLLARGLGFEIKRRLNAIKPVLAEENLSWNRSIIKKGFVAGIRQEVIGYALGKERVRLEVEMRLRPENEKGEDAIEIKGTPAISLKIHGGVRGEEATAATIVNLVPRLLHQPKYGFFTLLDLPLSVL